jgi:hypothetical protein
MIEARIKVEHSEVRYTNPFYGDVLTKQTYEETLMRDKDTREDVAPSGINALFSKNGEMLDIFINKWYLDSIDNLYIAIFDIRGRTYEINVEFDENNEIKDVFMDEWLSNGSFEDGEDSDNTYHLEDFVKVEKYES